MNARDKFLDATINALPPQEISSLVLIEKYGKDGETTAAEIQTRVAYALASIESPGTQEFFASKFLSALQKGFVPAGRINSAAGTDIQATLINCFVQPVGDSIRDFDNGRPGIYVALEQAAETMRRGGGVGYDFSTIRPEGAWVKKTNSRASGPLSFMKVFDASCETVESAGSRRGAQMGVLRCDHPDILKFIRAKDDGSLKNFNLSIGVTDAFMNAVEKDALFELIHAIEPATKTEQSIQRVDGKWIYETIKARELWDKVMKSTYDHAEPGIIFLDQMNRENNLHYIEVIETTNPCAEQPLPPYGCCCLGSINLTKFVRNPFTAEASFDFESYKSVIQTSIRMLDNVLDLTFWPLEQQKEEAMSKRRIGLGFLGLGDALVMLGLPYNGPTGRDMAASMSEVLRDQSYAASIALAIEKGAFPLLDTKKYLESGFAKRLPKDIRSDIKKSGIRNSHLLSIAPAGTISLAFADNASNGIEPAFSWMYTRKKRMVDQSIVEYVVEDHAWRLYRHLGGDVNNLPSYFVTALEMSTHEHFLMMKAVQPFIDTSISKTVNVPADYPYADFQNLYMDAWKGGLKGLATYRPNSVLGSVLSVIETAPVAADTPVENQLVNVDPLTKSFSKRPAGELPSVTSKVEMWTQEGKRSLYVSISFMLVDAVVDGKNVTIERPAEFFLAGSQHDAGQQWVDLSLRTISMAFRYGVSVEKTIENMLEITWDLGPIRSGVAQKADGTEVPRYHGSVVAACGYELQSMLKRRGFLDSQGRQVPVRQLAAQLANRNSAPVELIEKPSKSVASAVVASTFIGTGAKCPECGAHAMHKRDGCSVCDNCSYIGSCG